jgi:nicotinate (nicotinamide) nucleotide adenylyltransferase
VRFHFRAGGRPGRLGILAGSFNPPTLAHVALIETASDHVDEVLCVVPRVFPHKIYHGALLDQRLEMLNAVRPRKMPCSIGVSEGGLFIEIAGECRQAYGPDPELFFLCGRDAAERIIEWDYGAKGVIDEMLREFSLLVASRQGRYKPPVQLAHHVRQLIVPRDLDEISSTAVRNRIRKGEPWKDLVPPAIHDTVERIYR